MAELKIKIDSNIDELMKKIVQLKSLIEEINKFDLTINVLNEEEEVVDQTIVKDKIIEIKPFIDSSSILNILSSS